jgi:hypothetical protein
MIEMKRSVNQQAAASPTDRHANGHFFTGK